VTKARIDAGLLNNAKVLSLSPGAFRLWVLARCLCAANLTDGRIEASLLATPLGARKRDVQELLDAGVWDRLQTGAIVDNTYLEDNPSRADVERQRQKVRDHRAGKRKQELKPFQDPVTETVSGGVTDTVSEPVSETGGDRSALSLDPSGSGSVLSSGDPECLPSYQPPTEADQVARARAPKASRKAKAEAWRDAQLALVPDETHRLIAAERRVDLELELAKFRDHDFARPREDAAATFRNWLRGARPLNGARPTGRAGDLAESLFAEAAALRAAEDRQ
jgi:hypothetical protein